MDSNIQIQITIGGVLIISVTMVTVFLFAGWLFKKWIGARIEKSIQHEYNKQLEDYQFSRLKRQKAELISALFSKWIKYYGRESVLLSKNELINHYEDLNRMSLELSLWLEDIEILNNIMTRLQNLDGAKDLRELVVDVRKFLIENKNDDFNSKNIVLWPLPDQTEKIYGPEVAVINNKK